MAGRVVLLCGRVVALVLLALATGWSLAPVQRSIATVDVDGVVRGSIAMSLVALAFVGVMLVGRRTWHPWVVLGLEATIAGVLAFVPAVLWMVWFEVNDWTVALNMGWVQPLAVAWLGVVVLRGIHQWREPGPRAFAEAAAKGDASPSDAPATDRTEDPVTSAGPFDEGATAGDPVPRRRRRASAPATGSRRRRYTQA